MEETTEKECYPKLLSAEMLINNMICLKYENEQTRYLQSHYIQDYVDAFSPSRGKGKMRRIIFTPAAMAAWGSSFEIQENGDLLLNGKDRYRAKDLWENSSEHIYSARKI